MSEHWIDVTVAIRPGTVTWPGDTEIQVSRVLSLDRGDPCTLSRLHMSAHAGTHMDAPAHFVRGGASIDQMPADAGIGPARVIAISATRSITAEELAGHDIRPGERVLLKTRNSDHDWETAAFTEDFVHLSPAAAEHLVERRVRLVGIDYLSVGGPGDDGSETHRVLLEAGIWIVEGLRLGDVPLGPVELVCLPLKIAGGDGAPCRAVIRSTGNTR